MSAICANICQVLSRLRRACSLEVVIRILLVEDDDEIADRLVAGLEASGFSVDRARNGDDAYAFGSDQQFDAAILDLGLPGEDGLTVLRMWRGESVSMPVLILTARGTLNDKVKGLNAGADDYITKPFDTAEIIARLRALARRTGGMAHPLLSNKNIALDTVSGKATVDGRVVNLTALELRMLTYFLLRVGRMVTQKELGEYLYRDEDTAESNTIEVYIARLRKKFGRTAITTVRGLGYRMD